MITILEGVVIIVIPSPVGLPVTFFENIFDVIDFSAIPAAILRRVVAPPILML